MDELPISSYLVSRLLQLSGKPTPHRRLSSRRSPTDGNRQADCMESWSHTVRALGDLLDPSRLNTVW